MILNFALTALALTSPTSGGDALAAPAPASSARAATDSRSVQITTEDKIALSGTYFEPRRSKKDKGKAPGAVLLHDAGGSEADLHDLADYLSRKGFAVLTVDLRGHGGSVTADLDWSKLDEDGRTSAWAFARRDVESATDYLADQDDVHASNVSLIGVGAAGALAAAHATGDENARAVVLLAPAPDAYGYNLVRNVGDLEGLPTLLVSSRDAKDDAERLQGAAHRYNDGYEYVDLTTVSKDTVLEDRKLGKEVGTWLMEKVGLKK